VAFDLDLKTLVFILGITHLMQVLVFYHQYRVNKTFPGLGWWLLWSAAEAAGFSFMLLRNQLGILPVAIIGQNLMIVAGTAFIYIGVRRFFNKEVNLRLIVGIITLFLAGLLYFLFIFDDIQVRSALISATLAIFSLLTAYSLFKDKISFVAVTANFNGVIFLVHGLIFVYRTMMIVMGTDVEDFFAPTLFNIIPFFDALIVSLVWTFGFVIMVNNRLSSEIAESKKQLQQIFNTSPDAAVITRLEDGMIVDFNEGYTAITGYLPEDMAGKSSIGISIWKDIKDRYQVVKLLKEKGYCDNYEARFVLKDGREITGLMSAKIINLQGVPHIISITRDITRRKQMEEKLRENNAEKDKFFSILAHDLRSPFNAFLGFTQMLVEELPSMTLEQIHQIALRMRKSATNLYGLLDNLLEWSRVQRGTIAFTPEPVVVKDIIMESLGSVLESAARKHIEFRFEIPDRLTILADSHMIGTVVRNLAANAVKYTNKGGTIKISWKVVDGNHHEFSIRDNGIGISPDLIPILFQSGTNANRPGTEGEPSSGLGLIICKDFIEKHGGRIWVESEEGAGSIFSFSIPLAPGQVTGA
jgi:PAS domain S-box-containing protein